MAEQGRPLADRRGEIAGQEGDRAMAVAAVGEALAADIHPRAAALAGPGVQVEVEAGPNAAVSIDQVEVAGIGMPEWHIATLGEGDPEHTAGNGEQAVQHGRQGEVGLEILFAEVEARLTQHLGGVGDIPGLEVGQAQSIGSERAQFGKFTLGNRFGTLRQIMQKGQHALGVAGHLVLQRDMGGAGEADQAGRFVAERENALDPFGVVEATGMWAAIGSAGVVGGVDRFAQAAIPGIGQDGLHRWSLQGGQVTFAAGITGGLCQDVAGGLRQADKLMFGDRSGPGIGGVEHGLREAGPEGTQFGLDGLEPAAFGLVETDPGQPELAQGILDQGPSGTIQTGELGMRVQGADSLEQGPILAKFGVVFGQFLLGLVVGAAQFRGILDAMQVADRCPGSGQTFGHALQRCHQPLEVAGLGIGDQAGDFGTVVGQQPIDGRIDVIGQDGRKIRQLMVGEQRVVSGVPAFDVDVHDRQMLPRRGENKVRTDLARNERTGSRPAGRAAARVDGRSRLEPGDCRTRHLRGDAIDGRAPASIDIARPLAAVAFTAAVANTQFPPPFVHPILENLTLGGQPVFMTDRGRIDAARACLLGPVIAEFLVGFQFGQQLVGAQFDHDRIVEIAEHRDPVGNDIFGIGEVSQGVQHPSAIGFGHGPGRVRQHGQHVFEQVDALADETGNVLHPGAPEHVQGTLDDVGVRLAGGG